MPFFKKYTTLIFICLSSNILFSQVDLGNNYFKQGDFTAALEAYQAENGKDDAIVEATFGISKVWANPQAAFYNLDSAYYYIRLAQRKHARLKDGVKKRMEKNEVGGKYLSRFRNAIADSALAQIQKNPSLAAYDQFLTYYDRISKKTEEAAIEASLVLVKKAFDQESDYPKLAKLFERFERNIQKKMFEDYPLFEAQLFTTFIKENGWDAYPEFGRQFPRNRFVMDRARPSFFKIRTSGKLENFERFAKLYSTSPYAEMARDSATSIMERTIARQEETKRLLASLKELKNDEELQKLDQQLVNRFREIITEEALEQMLPKNKAANLPNLLAVVYKNNYRSKATIERLKQFKQQYAGYPNMNQVDIDLLRLELAAQKMPPLLQPYNDTVIAFAPKYKAFLALQTIIGEELKAKNWPTALAIVKKYAPLFNDESKAVNELITVLEAPEQALDIQRLGGDNINGPRSEYSPVLSADGNTLFFCRRVSVGGVERIFAAEKGSDGKWTEAQTVDDLNATNQNYAPIGISIDGTRLLIFKMQRIAYADKTKEGWTPVREYGRNINVSRWQGAATLSSNNRVLIFEARYRQDALPSPQGDHIDLFITQKNPDGTWGKSVNLGEVINTPFDERSPFLHPDMRTLYFSSAGHGGLGSLDVYKTTRLDDTWTKWSEPENLGKGINTYSRDWGYKISTDGTMAYYSAAPERQSDLFQVTLPENLRPQLVSTLTLLVVDEDDNPLEADILLENLTKGSTLGELRTDPGNGEAFVVLPHEGRYGYIVTKEGYYPVSNNIDLEEEGQQLQVKEVIKLIKIEKIIEEGGKIELKNLFFDFDKSSIQPSSYLELERAAKIIIESGSDVTVLGHTDNKGAPDYNKDLSERRAAEVRTYLIKMGVPEAKITSKGLGEAQPITTNDTEKGRATNRRVEIQFVK